MPGGSIRGSSPVHCRAQVLAPSVGVGASRGTAADVGAKCWCWRISGDRTMLAPSVGVGATRRTAVLTAADGDEAWQFTQKPRASKAALTVQSKGPPTSQISQLA